MSSPSARFVCGVVEGFYGKPWNARQRHQLFCWMREWGMNTYLYAPKDDLKHRNHWRILYSEMEVAELAGLIRDCHRNGLDFIYSIAPGLDMRYSGPADRESLKEKLRQVKELGCNHFAFLFDDIPYRMQNEDAARFRSFAEAHCSVANEMAEAARGWGVTGKFLFCPTPYCGAMAEKNPEYLPEIGRKLDPAFEVLWTGPQIISEEISIESIQQLSQWIGRKPLLWDNLHANDYDLRRIYLGPYSGRSIALRGEISGILSNPNCQFEANYVPLRTLALYVKEDRSWDERAAYKMAQKEWASLFQVEGTDAITMDDLEFLGDFFYLPHRYGKQGTELAELVRWLLSASPSEWKEKYDRWTQICSAVIHLFSKLSELRNRDLLFSLYPFLWELKEELILIRGYLDWVSSHPKAGEHYVSSEHRPRTYRGGLTAELQRFITMDESGRFLPARRGSLSS